MKNGFLLLPEGGMNWPENPQRIVSLVPSQTELLYHLGIGHRVVGITKFCIHPEEWYRSKNRVGGTKRLKLNRIKALQPDLIIANKEENTRAEIEALAKDYIVYVSDVEDLRGALGMIEDIGELTETQEKAESISAEITNGFDRMATESWPTLRAAYFIWKDPWMSIGGDTFISKMMDLAQLENVFASQQRYPQFEMEDLVALKPEVLLLSSEPYPFKEKHIDLIRPYFPDTPIKLVDGEMFSWYGSHLRETAPYLRKLRKDLLKNKN